MSTVTLRPNGQGSETAVQAPGVKATHWQMVDEDPHDGSATFIHVTIQSSQWWRDLYTIPNTENVGAISKVEVFAVTSHAISAMHNSLRTHDTSYDSLDDNGLGPWTLWSWEWTTNPFTGEAWTWDEINALEIGVQLRGSLQASPLSDCTQVYAEVTFTPTVAPTVTTDPATEVT